MLKKDAINNIQKESKKMTDIFREEIFEIIKKHKEEPKKQCWRRIYIRSVFAFIESECFSLKKDTLNMINRFSEANKFSPGDISFLKEKAYTLNNKGKIREKELYSRTEDNLRFAFNSASKFSIDFELDVSDVGWFSFKKALKARHRVTHPKRLSDLNISEKEIDDTQKAFNWFLGSLASLRKAQEKYLNGRANDVRELAREIEDW